MKKHLFNFGYAVFLIALVIYFPNRIYRVVQTKLVSHNALIRASVEGELNQQVLIGNLNQLHRDTPLGLFCHLPEYVMASVLRTGKQPSKGSLQESYDNGYDSVVEGVINIPKNTGYKAYFDEVLMLYSAGADGEFGTEDDIGIAVESKAVDDALAKIKSGKVDPTWYNFP